MWDIVEHACLLSPKSFPLNYMTKLLVFSEHSFSVHPKEEEENTEGMLDVASMTHNLVVYLQKNGHLGLSVECLRQMMATALRCLLYQGGQKVCRVD